jgi:hypothetical protein
MYDNPWMYQGEVFDENLVDRYHGFVYCITCPDGRKYIGRKTFWFMRKYGSSDVVKDLINQSETSNFQREILSLHKTKGEMNYTEVKEQFQRNVLESSEYLNDNINGKYFKSRVSKWNENEPDNRY